MVGNADIIGCLAKITGSSLPVDELASESGPRLPGPTEFAGAFY